MADRFQLVGGEPITLALAVNPVDARTGEPLREAAVVTVDGAPDTPVFEPELLNPSGYWLFLTDSDDFPSTPTVRVDTPPRYVDRTVEDPSSVGIRVDVYPSRLYSFPPGTTLVLGTVIDGESGEAVTGATVRLKHTTIETRTTTDGTFVLPVEGIATQDSFVPGDVLRIDESGNGTDEVRVYPVIDTSGENPRHGEDELPTLIVDPAGFNELEKELHFAEGERVEMEDPIEVMSS